MLESIRSQDSTTSSGADLSRDHIQVGRVSQETAASTLANAAFHRDSVQRDSVQLSEEAQKELRELKQRDRKARNQRSAVLDTPYGQKTQDVRTSPDRLGQEPYVQRTYTVPDQTSREQIYQDQTSSEAFVAASRLFSASSQETTLSFAHGTYHRGRQPSSAYGFMPYAQENISSAYTSMSGPARMQHAQKTYAVISTQGVMPTALAPSGTGISIRV